MAEVMVTVMPLAGHVAPVLRAVEALIAAGHRVRVYVGAAYADPFQRAGATVIAWREAPDFDEHDLQATFPQVGRTGPWGLLANLEHVFLRSAVGQVADLLAAFWERPWDVLVADSLSVGGALAAEKTGTLWATLSVVPLSMPSRDLPPPNLRVEPARGPVGRSRDVALRVVVAAATGGLRRAYRQVRAAVGLHPRGRSLAWAWFSPQLVLALGIAALEAPRSDLPEQVHFIGTFPAAGGGLPVPLQAADGMPPVVHVTQGTFNVDPEQLLRPALAALAGRPATVVAATGIEGVDTLPFAVAHDVIVVGRVSYAQLLPRTSVMITNGGWGGVLAGVAHGIPLILAGSDLDKPVIAAMVARSGAGIDLRTGTPTKAQVARALDRIEQDPSFRHRARALAAGFHTHETAAELVNLIEQLLTTRARVDRISPAWPDRRL